MSAGSRWRSPFSLQKMNSLNRRFGPTEAIDSAEHCALNSNQTGLINALWERAPCAVAQLLNFQEEMARPKRFELLTSSSVRLEDLGVGTADGA
jgi:hypothetical protein